MLSLPPEPNPGEPIKASLIRSLIQAIRSLRPIPGPGVRLSTGPNGTTFSVETARKSVTEAVQETKPWSLAKETDPVSGELVPVWKRKIIQIGYSLYDYDSELYSEKYSDSTEGADGWYYLKLTFEPDNFSTVPVAEMVCLDQAPTSDWTNHIHYVYIGRVQNGVQTAGTYTVPIIYMYI